MASLEITLNDLAKEMVGDGKTPNAYFVTVRSKTVLMFLTGDGLDDDQVRATAISIADTFSGTVPVVVEDRLTGTVWENEAAQYESNKPDDEYEPAQDYDALHSAWLARREAGYDEPEPKKEGSTK